jgi:hypothetical protein
MLIPQKSFLIKLITFLLSLITMSVLSTKVNAEQTSNNGSQFGKPLTLVVTPERCVALHRGQTCYLDVVFTWQHAEQGDYCLVNKTTNIQIKCWDQKEKGEYRLDFQSPASNYFGLRKKSSQVDLVSTKIEVAWVYNSSKRAKSSWRLF